MFILNGKVQREKHENLEWKALDLTSWFLIIYVTLGQVF